jgi:hypothetical protein
MYFGHIWRAMAQDANYESIAVQRRLQQIFSEA